MAAMSSADQSQWHKLLPVTAFAYRTTPVAHLGFSPFFLTHGRHAVLPGELIAAPASRAPVDREEFVADLRRSLTTAFSQARELEIQEKLQRHSLARFVPHVEHAVGDKVLLHRVVVDPDDSHKLTPRWVPHVVTYASHPHYRVQDSASRVSRTIARFLRPDDTSDPGYVDHIPPQPSADSTADVDNADQPLPESFVIVTSQRADEPWCLANVRGDADDPAFVDIHYYNRTNKASAPDKWVWRPAYVDPRDGVDVLTYTPKRRYQPYFRTIPRSMILASDVRLTKAGSISAVDLRRISSSPRTPWVFRRRADPTTSSPKGIGSLVSKSFGRHGEFVGEVVSTREADGRTLYRVVYTDGDFEELSKTQLSKYMRRHHNSAARHTATASQPSSSLLQSKRLRRATKRRPPASTTAARAAVTRSRRRR